MLREQPKSNKFRVNAKVYLRTRLRLLSLVTVRVTSAGLRSWEVRKSEMFLLVLALTGYGSCRFAGDDACNQKLS